MFRVAFSPDGGFFATGGQDHTVRLWDAVTGEQVAQFDGDPGDVYAIAFGPDSTTLAISCGVGVVRLWDLATAELRQDLAWHDDTVRGMAFSPDGASLATAGDDGFVCLWSPRDGQQIRRFDGHDGGLLSIAFSPDGETFATAGDNGTVRLWRTPSVQPGQPFVRVADRLSALAYSPDGAALATASGEGIQLWDIAARQLIRRFAHPGAATLAVAYSPDGAIVATAGDDGTVRLWEAATGQQIGQLAGHDAPATGVAFSPVGGPLVTVGLDGGIRRWDAATKQQIGKSTGHSGLVHAAAYSPDGAILATGGDNGTIRLWEATTGQPVRQLAGHIGWVNDIAYSPDGAVLATTADDSARLWDAATGQEIRQLTGHRGLVWGVAFNPDGATLATASDKVIRLWEVATGREVGEIVGQHDTVSTIAYAPDGSALAASTDSNGGIGLWDPATGQSLRQFAGHGALVAGIAYSPDGATLATTDFGGAVRLLDAATGQQIRGFAGHDGIAWGVGFSPDASVLATVGREDGVRLWDAASGQQRHHLTGHDGIVYKAVFSPDGSTLASVGLDGTIRIWNVRNGAQVNGTGFGEARASTRLLAGVRSDRPSQRDLLGVADDVQMLAELITAAETTPPLAIALIGDWGVGKSSAMLQVEEQVSVLADRARSNPGLTAWAESVRQVRFNAWHYSDESLWAGLVSHLFEALAAQPQQLDQLDQRGGVQAKRPIAEERRRLQDELAAKQKASDELASELRAVGAADHTSGILGWLVTPWFAARVLAAAVRQGLKNWRTGAFAVAGWALFGTAAYFAWLLASHWIAAIVTAVALITPPILPAVRRMQAGREALLGFADRQQARLAARQQGYRRDITVIQDQLVLVDAAARLGRFLDDRATGSAYHVHEGLLGQVRADLDQLSADLAAARGQWERAGRFGPPPLERIVLYIDDLDRCPPSRVVKVLEAVHLMLALDLFVVIVAVDARWLIRSLEYHHRELFAVSQMEGDELATPVDYLDKIFQIPFVLPPPRADATAAYVRSLLPEPTQRTAPGSGVQAAGGNASGPLTRNGADAAHETGHEDDADVRHWEGFEWSHRDRHNQALPGIGLRGRPENRRPPRPAAFELRPQGLQVTHAEVEFMARLGALLPTPRAAKRLVNIYRLVRIGIPADALADFAGDQGGPYQTVQVLLAILSGHPLFAREVFRNVIAKTHATDLAAVVRQVAGQGEGSEEFEEIHAFLAQAREEAPLAVDITLCRQWCPRLARFSFYTRDLAADWRDG